MSEEVLAKEKLLLSISAKKAGTNEVFSHIEEHEYPVIKKFSESLDKDEEFDLQSIMSSGIYGLFVKSEGGDVTFETSEFGFNSKVLSIVDCEFIDVKLKNKTEGTIRIEGIVTGEE